MGRERLGMVVRIFGMRIRIEGLAGILDCSLERYNGRACRYLTGHLRGCETGLDQITQEKNKAGNQTNLLVKSEYNDIQTLQFRI